MSNDNDQSVTAKTSRIKIRIRYIRIHNLVFYKNIKIQNGTVRPYTRQITHASRLIFCQLGGEGALQKRFKHWAILCKGTKEYGNAQATTRSLTT